MVLIIRLFKTTTTESCFPGIRRVQSKEFRLDLSIRSLTSFLLMLKLTLLYLITTKLICEQKIQFKIS